MSQSTKINPRENQSTRVKIYRYLPREKAADLVFVFVLFLAFVLLTFIDVFILFKKSRTLLGVATFFVFFAFFFDSHTATITRTRKSLEVMMNTIICFEV